MEASLVALPERVNNFRGQVAQAQDIRDAYARGALSEEDAIARLKAIK